MKFSIRDLLWFTVVVALCLALVYVKWPNGIGRYQMSSGGVSDPKYILDTATGRIWAQPGYDPDPGAKWFEYSRPDYGK
jgi:hypothetical protein